MTLAVPTDPNLTELASAKLLPAMLTHLPPCEGPARGETLVTTGGFDAAEAAGSVLGDPRPVASRSAGVTTATMRIPRDFARRKRTVSTGRGAARRRLMTGLFLLRGVTGAVDSEVIGPQGPVAHGPFGRISRLKCSSRGWALGRVLGSGSAGTSFPGGFPALRTAATLWRGQQATGSLQERNDVPSKRVSSGARARPCPAGRRALPHPRFDLRRPQPPGGPCTGCRPPQESRPSESMTPTAPTKEADKVLPAGTAVPPAPPPAITEMAGPLKLQRRLTLCITIIPFLGFLVGLRLLWGGISGLDLGLLVGLYSFSILGVTVGYHRMLTHGAFDAPAPVRIAFAIAGSFAVEGSVIRWVADHRRHHMFTDRPGDPHSPHLGGGEGLKGVLLGLWHAHIGWFFVEETTVVPRFAPDLLKDRGMRIVGALFPLWVMVSFAAAPAIALVVTHSLHAALTALVWGSLVRIFLLHHVTWSINSICHFYGKRPYDTGDFSTNNWVMSLVSFGEGWHNNHHAFPSSALHGLEWWQVDITGMVIRGMHRLGLIRNLRIPSPKQLALQAVAPPRAHEE